MNCLIIDCSAGMKIYLLKDGKEFSKIDENQKKHTDELLVAVDELLNEAGLKPNKIDVVGVCEGPGSFTGIRVAVSICKGLAVESKMKIVTASNFDIYQAGVKGDAIFVLEGFSDFVYVRKFLNNSVEDSCDNINDFADNYLSNLKNIDVYVSNEKMQSKLKLFEIDAKIATLEKDIALLKRAYELID